MFFRYLLVVCPPILIALIGISVWGLTIYFSVRSARKRVTPLTNDLLRPPGHSLQERANDLTYEIETSSVMQLVMPLSLYSIIMGDAYWQLNMMKPFVIVILSLFLVGAMALSARQTARLWQKRRNVLLGLDGERAVAEELNQLMLDGARVFTMCPSHTGMSTM